MVMNGLQDWTIVKEVPVVHMIQVNGSCLVIALQILFPKFERMNMDFHQYTVKKEGGYLYIIGNCLLTFNNRTFSVVSDGSPVLP